MTAEILGGESMGRGKCPQCGAVGYLQGFNKGRFFRIRHDQMIDRRPKFHYHQISIEDAKKILALDEEVSRRHNPLVNNQMDTMTQRLKSNDPNLRELASNEENKCGRSLVWSRTSACHADDPGSNLGDRTIFTFKHPSQVLMRAQKKASSFIYSLNVMTVSSQKID